MPFGYYKNDELPHYDLRGHSVAALFGLGIGFFMYYFTTLPPFQTIKLFETVPLPSDALRARGGKRGGEGRGPCVAWWKGRFKVNTAVDHANQQPFYL